MDDQPLPPPGPPIAYPHRYVNQDIAIVDLAVPVDAAGHRKIVDTEFYECVIRGPVLLLVGDETILRAVNDIEGDPQGAFRTLAPGEPLPRDAILIDDCLFTLCRFRDVIFVGDIRRLNGLKRIFGTE